MIKWLRERSAQEKWMLALIAVLLVGIAVRWAWVSSEVAGAWRERFSVPSEQVSPTDTSSDTSTSTEQAAPDKYPHT